MTAMYELQWPKKILCYPTPLDRKQVLKLTPMHSLGFLLSNQKVTTDCRWIYAFEFQTFNKPLSLSDVIEESMHQFNLKIF